MTVKTYVEFDYRDKDYLTKREVEDRDLEKIDFPQGAFSATFFDQVEAEVEFEGKSITLRSNPFNISTPLVSSNFI